MSAKIAVPTAPVIAVLNMKGGVGKTTISAHLMRIIYERAKVNGVLIDLDPQFNLTQTLVPRIDYDKLRATNKTVYSAMEQPSSLTLFQVAAATAPAPPISELATAVHTFTSGNEKRRLELVAGDFRLVKYSLIDNHEVLQQVQSRFLKFIDDAAASYGLVCIDCNPSSSFITNCALRAATHLAIPVKPDLYSVLGVELLHDLLGDMPIAKPPISIILNTAQGRDFDPEVENNLRGHKVFGQEVLVNNLRHSKLLEARSAYIGFATDRRGRGSRSGKLYRDMVPLADELSKRLGL